MARHILSFLAGCAVTAVVIALTWGPRRSVPSPGAATGDPATRAIAGGADGADVVAEKDGAGSELPHTATIRCRLVLPPGVPSPSRVPAWWNNDTAEAELVGGLLTIHVPPVAGHASFQVDGCVVIERDVAPTGGGVTDWGTITLVASTKLLGYVVDIDGRPVRAFVFPRVGDASVPLTGTDETGAFSFDGLPYGDAELRVEGEGYVTRTEHYRFVAGAKPALLTVVRGGGVRGIVLDAEGRPAPKVVYVTFVERDDPENRDLMGFPHVEDDGRFEVRLLAGRYRARATLGSLEATADVDVVEGETRELELKLRTP